MLDYLELLMFDDFDNDPQRKTNSSGFGGTRRAKMGSPLLLPLAKLNPVTSSAILFHFPMIWCGISIHSGLDAIQI
jgi:hypothetical protein